MGELIIDVPDMPNVDKIQKVLVDRYGFTLAEAAEVIRYTVQDTKRWSKEWKVEGGFITLRYHGLSRFSLEDNVDAKKVVSRRNKGYSSPRTHRAPQKGPDMPPARGRRQAAAPEPEPNGEVDFTTYLEKNLSNTMIDYATWFRANVGNPDDIESDRLLALGVGLYPHFQRSDFNIAQREARRAAREAPPEPEPAAPARGGRGRAKAPAAAAAPPARGRGRRGASRQPEAAY